MWVFTLFVSNSILFTIFLGMIGTMWCPIVATIGSNIFLLFCHHLCKGRGHTTYTQKEYIIYCNKIGQQNTDLEFGLPKSLWDVWKLYYSLNIKQRRVDLSTEVLILLTPSFDPWSFAILYQLISKLPNTLNLWDNDSGWG